MIGKISKDTIICVQVTDDVKDEALDYSIANGTEDVILEMETFKERFIDKKTDASKDLKLLIRQAESDKAEYIHLH
jgi:hypothetical protein